MTLSISFKNSYMYCEAKEASSLVSQQLFYNNDTMEKIARKLRQSPPTLVITCARGSSDNAATYAKYLIETQLGIPTLSAALSIQSLYKIKQKFENSLFLAISQSGKSHDLIANVKAAKEAGATVIAIVNNENSPLFDYADMIIGLRAGDEKSVAATKSYIASLSAIFQLVAYWMNYKKLYEISYDLPKLLKKSWELDWSSAISKLNHDRGLFVIGRGIGFGIAQEAALKFKETCGLHAEAFSAAEVLHGPMAIVKDDFPIFSMAQNDEGLQSIKLISETFLKRNATVITAGFSIKGGLELPTIDANPLIQPILMIQSFYKMAAQLSFSLGHNPDHPPYLNKITETV